MGELIHSITTEDQGHCFLRVILTLSMVSSGREKLVYLFIRSTVDWYEYVTLKITLIGLTTYG